MPVVEIHSFCRWLCISLPLHRRQHRWMYGPYCWDLSKIHFSSFLQSVNTEQKGDKLKGETNTNCRGVVSPQALVSVAPWQRFPKSLDLHFSSVILLHYSEILDINFRLFVALTESYHCFAFTLNKSANQIMYAWNPTKAEYRLILYFYIKSALFLTILSITSYSFLH